MGAARIFLYRIEDFTHLNHLCLPRPGTGQPTRPEHSSFFLSPPI